MALTTSFVANAANNTTTTGYSFSSLSFGTAAADRQILIATAGQAGSAGSVNSVTIGGVSATFLFGVSSATVRIEFWIASVPTGTSGTVAITWAAQRTRCAVVVWRVVGGASTTAFDSGSEVNFGTGAGNDALDIPAGGSCFGAVYDAGTGGRNWTWTGLTESVDTTFASGRSYSGARTDQASAQSGFAVSSTPSGSTTASVFAAVSLQMATPPPVDGEADVTFGPLAIDASGSAIAHVAGAADVLLGGMSISAFGYMRPDGGIAVDLSAPTIDATGAQEIPGVADVSLAGLIVDAIGKAKLDAAGDVALQAVEIAATGIVQPTGAAAIDLAALVLDALGAQSIPGSAEVDLDGVSLDASGVMQPSGAADVTIDPVEIDGTGEQSAPGVSGAADVTLGALEIAGLGLLRLEAAALVELAGVMVDGLSGGAITGSAAVDLSGLSIDAAAMERISGAAALVLSAVAVEAFGDSRVVGSAQIDLPALILAGLGSVRVDGVGNVSLNPLVIEGSSEARITGAAGLILEAMQIAARGEQRLAGAGDIQFGPVDFSGLGEAEIRDAASIMLQAMIVEAIASVILPTSLMRVIEMSGGLAREEFRGRVRRVLDFKGKLN